MASKSDVESNVTAGTGLIEHYVYRKIVIWLISTFRLDVNPNLITMLSLVYALFCSYLIVSGHPLVGSILYIFFNVLDLLDGAIARVYNRKSVFGAFFDGLVDVLSEIVILYSIGIYFDMEIQFLYLVVFILLAHYIYIRVKWIVGTRERQKNMFDYWGSPMLLVLLSTRNDTRKVMTLIGILFNAPHFILLYFTYIYVLSIVSSIMALGEGKT